MEVVVSSVKVEGWGGFGPICQADKVSCYIITCCLSAQGPISQMWLYSRTVGISGSEVAGVATKMSVAKVPSYLRF